MRRLRDMKTRAAAYGVAALLFACATGFLAFSAYLALSRSVEPVLAALYVGAALLFLAALAILVSRVTAGRNRRRADPGNPFDGLESALEHRVDPVVNDWIRRHPERAALATVVLGVAAGYSGSARRVLQDLFNQYVEAEDERRSRRPR